MADPTLKDVLKAIAEIQRQMATKTDLAEVRNEIAHVRNDLAQVSNDVAAVDAKVDAHRAETKKAFDELDRDLARHMKVHAELEKDVELLKKRPARTAARPTRTPRGR